MATIQIKKNSNGKQYVYLIESVRVGKKTSQRIIERYGSLEKLEKQNPNFLQELKESLKEVNNSEIDYTKNLNFFSLIDNENKDNLANKSYKKFGWMILEDIYNGLKINKVISSYESSKRQHKYPLNKVLKLLVFQRILDPDSKLETFQQQKYLFGDWELSQNDIYRSLKELNSLKRDISLHVHNEITKYVGRTATLVFYDVTNYYFEIDQNDKDEVDSDGNVIKPGMRKLGPSKEQCAPNLKPNPIVQLGLFMDSNGIPISYKLFSGNRTDPVTYVPALKEVKEQFGLERIIVVADKAMNSKTNIESNTVNGDGYLFSQKHKGKVGVSQELQEFILNGSEWKFSPDGNTAKKSFIREKKINKDLIVKEKVLVTWNKNYADREARRRGLAMDYILAISSPSVFAQTCKKGAKKYISFSTRDLITGKLEKCLPEVNIDYDSIEFDSLFDGINVLVTSEIDMNDDEIISSYRQLSKIEDCFRVTKTFFKSRPVYVRREESIEAHFLTCFLSLIILRLFQHATNWEVSPRNIIQILNSLEIAELRNKVYAIEANEEIHYLTKHMGLDKPIPKYLRIENLNKLFKNWFEKQLKNHNNQLKKS